MLETLKGMQGGKCVPAARRIVPRVHNVSVAGLPCEKSLSSPVALEVTPVPARTLNHLPAFRPRIVVLRRIAGYQPKAEWSKETSCSHTPLARPRCFGVELEGRGGEGVIILVSCHERSKKPVIFTS